jgi:predicted esterase
MKENEISFPFKARYYKTGEINSSTRQVWFVLHGYGQLARYFINKFKILQLHNICVIAPEGLSHFYLEAPGPSGRKNNRVGATWMTKENRELDIANYIHYLDTIYSKELADTQLPVTVLGFSQGSATASRWIMNNRIQCDRLILWAGLFPPDMDFNEGSKLLKRKKIFVVYGKNDPFINDERVAEMKSLIQKLNAEVKDISFDGEHDIDEDTLLKFV